MIIYVIIFLSLIVANFIWAKKNVPNVTFYFLLCFFIAFVGFRDMSVDRDYTNYLIAIANEDMPEVTFNFIAKICKDYLGSGKWLFFIFAALGISLKFTFFRHISPFFFLSILIYFSNNFIFQEMTQIRAGVAVGFLFWSIYFLIKKHFLKFLLLVLCATCFHYTAIIFLFFYPVLNNNHKYIKLFFILIFGAYIMYLLKIDILEILQFIPIKYIQQKYIDYKIQAETDISTNVWNLMQICRIILFCYLLSFSKKIANHFSNVYIFLKMYGIAIICVPLFYGISGVAYRLMDIFLFSEIILIPLIYYTIKEKIFAYSIIVTVSLLYLITNLFYYNILNPYSIHLF